MENYRVWKSGEKEYKDVKSKNIETVLKRFFGKNAILINDMVVKEDKKNFQNYIVIGKIK